MTPFTQPNSHADRLAQRVQSVLASEGDSGWMYLGCCVQLDADTINFITEDWREEDLTQEAFWALVGEDALTLINHAFKYTESEWSIQEDNHVEYRRSRLPHDHPDYPGRDVVFFDHSRIEYVWVKMRTGDVGP